ncbi:DUF3592 domain-containing protein [Paraburkholderia sediminicola]|uniref:DUF3592 domain-containing protein n=1 Tax=Paraburkholderia sediminicola TaxID=458836 RepID=UPI0038BBDC04
MSVFSIARSALSLAILIFALLRLARQEHWSGEITATVLVVLSVVLLGWTYRIERGKAQEASEKQKTASPSQSSARKTNPTFVRLLIAWLLLIGCFFCIPGYQMLCRAQSTHAEKTWPSVEGTIQTVQIKSRVTGGHTIWYPVWSYSYFIDGNPYLAGSRDLPGGYQPTGYDSERDATANATSRPMGAKVTVYYDPVAHQRSVLDRRIWTSLDWEVTMLVLMFPLVVFGGGFVLYRALLYKN